MKDLQASLFRKYGIYLLIFAILWLVARQLWPTPFEISAWILIFIMGFFPLPSL